MAWGLELFERDAHASACDVLQADPPRRTAAVEAAGACPGEKNIDNDFGGRRDPQKTIRSVR